MDVLHFLRELEARSDYRHQIVHVREIPVRPARFAAPETPLLPALRDALMTEGISRLYSHQAAAFDAVSERRDTVVVTGTASGKTLCYNLPVLQTLAADSKACALYLFPTKALAQDQLGALQRLVSHAPHLAQQIRPATYDGDTPTGQRGKIRQSANLILSNPDMLHQAILPHHGKWATFLANLRYVVLDEIHTYRGIFGSHVACVLRRLQRLCSHYGGHPVFVASSATIANPQELAAALIGRSVHVVDDDGSPRGRKYFVLWNPPLLDNDTLQRRSANIEAQHLMRDLILTGAQTIAFAKARVVAELLYRYLRDDFARSHRRLLDRVRPYRGGYLSAQRREIESQLFSGKLLGVCSTNALELGIDVGSLDAALVVGFPGTIASTWQQAGRAGRSNEESVAVLIAYNDPIDQYLCRHPDYFFAQPHENAVIDPQNPFILAAQLTCAAAELPLAAADETWFGSQVLAVCEQLAQSPDDGWWHDQKNDTYRYHDRRGTQPTARVSLRLIGNDTYDIVDVTTSPPRSIGNVDVNSAPELVYPNAVYLHEGDTYLVRDLDLTAKIARVQQADLDYYTQPILHSTCRVVGTETDVPYRAGRKYYGTVDVTWQTIAFKKIKYYSMELIGQAALDLPPQNLATTALWLTAPPDLLKLALDNEYKPIDGLVGVRNLMLACLPLLAMCDRRDISGLIDSTAVGQPAMFVYDRYPGGVGYALKGYDLLDELLDLCRTLVTECPCRDGCPSCVGLANLRPPLHQDPDLGLGYPIPDKAAARFLLHHWLARP